MATKRLRDIKEKLKMLRSERFNRGRKSSRDQDVAKILEANKNKTFVQRILHKDKYPTLKNEDGSSSTHSMAWSEVDGKYIVYPTVLYGGGDKMKRFGDKEAVPLAMESGNYIEFDNPEQADWFSREYKSYWQK